MDQRRGWLKRDGWWMQKDWTFGLKFTEGTENNFFYKDNDADLRLRDVVQYVTHVRSVFRHKPRGIEILLNTMELSEESRLEDITFDQSCGQSLARSIESGCLRSLKRLQLGDSIGDGHFDLAKAMASVGLPKLETLSLTDTDLNDSTFAAYGTALIAGMLPNLSCLDISNNGIRDEGVKSLGLAIRSGNLKNLVKLDLNNAGIANDGLIALADSFQEGMVNVLPHLSSLCLRTNSFNDAGLLLLAEALSAGKLPSLSCLDISHNKIGVEGAKSLGLAIRSGNLKNLAQLELNNTGIANDGLNALADSFQEGMGNVLPHLSSLCLRTNSFNELGLLSLAEALSAGKLPNLSRLDVSNNYISNKGAKAFRLAFRSGNLKNLAQLELNNIGIANEGLIALLDSFQEGMVNVLPHLSSLCLRTNSFKEAGLLSLAKALSAGKLPSLSCLDISYNRIGDEGAKCVGFAIRSGKLKNLAQLELNNSGIANDGLVALADSFQEGMVNVLPHLSSLCLRSNSFNELGLLSLAEALSAGKLPNLSCLDFSMNNVGDEGAKCVGLAIRSGKFKSLASFKLNNTRIADVDFVALADSLPDCLATMLPNSSSWSLLDLTCLDLSMKNVGDEGAKSLGLAIRSGKLKSLEVLYLKGNNIADDGLSALADSFRGVLVSVLPSLSSLDLTGNSFTKVGLLSLAEALGAGQLAKLSCLDISHNKIGNDGATSLGLAIRCGNLKNLAELRMCHNSIADDGLIALADTFQKGLASVLPNLSSLDLQGNQFTEVGLLSLVEALKSGRLNTLDALNFGEVSEFASNKAASALVSAFSSNKCLTVDVKFEWYNFPELARRKDQLIERNSKNKDILAGLVNVPKVPAASGKVYLCGSPEVGKTTLRRTLQRSFLKSLLTWERKPHVEKRTRGIAVSQFSSKGNKPDDNSVTLLVWDMAGQEDFHLIHNAFFPDLGFAEGKATSFVVVCSSNKHLQESKEELEYWLRYIASSCDKTNKIPRHVFVVMNNIKGDRMVYRDEQHWEMLIEGQRDKFKDYLKIRTDLFSGDVRRRQKVKGLKRCLLEHSSNLLRDEKVPKLCQVIQENLAIWSQARKRCPVLEWTAFVEVVAAIEPWPESVIESATKYLSEAGVVVYIKQEGVRLVVLDPNWFCREIVGRIFLPEGMESSTENLFRDEVDKASGSISISNFKRFFQSLWGEWTDPEFEDLITILLWLGLCYKGRDKNVFIPALIKENGAPSDPWHPKPPHEQKGDQWVMGFSVKHQESEVTLAPISLWHRFQVDLAQTPKFNGQVADNDFVADKYFMTFAVDYMSVLIEVDANPKKPTFEEISIRVKPKFERDDLDPNERKQCQVDLAHDLVERLLKLWNQVCPGVEYVQKVVWPWPTSQPRLEVMPKRNVDVARVKMWVQEHGLGRKMQWAVGSSYPVVEDQLLSTKDKIDVMQSVEHSLSIVSQGMEEAVNLKIFPHDVLTDEVLFAESVPTSDGMDMPVASPTNEEQDVVCKKLSKLLSKKLSEKLKPIENKVDKVYKTLGNVEKMVREGFGDVLKKQTELLQKLQDTERMFLEDRQQTCPKFIYLSKSDSTWATLKEALSISVTVHLQFACEARYSDYRPHADVKDQQGLDVSQLADWAETIVPWLKVSLTVLFISAKVAANIVAPGMGLILPGFEGWRQVSTLSEGIASATGFSKGELDKRMMKGMGLDANDPHWDPRGLYGKSRKAISELIDRLKLNRREFEKKIGLQKVALKYPDGTSHVVWMCTGCFEKFWANGMVTEVD